MTTEFDLQLGVKVTSPLAVVPRQAKPGDAGFDLTSIETHQFTPGEIRKLRTGIHVEIPPGHFGLVMSRSSLVAKGVQVGPAVIDSGYRGELFLLTANYSHQDVWIHEGDRIGQVVIVPFASPTVVVKDELSVSARGEGGFGSSGR